MYNLLANQDFLFQISHMFLVSYLLFFYMDIEEEFDIEITDEDAESLHTVGDIRKYIEDNT